MSIYITGDCHGDFQRFTTRNFPQLKELDRDDYVILAGDFGGVWAGEQVDGHKLDWLEDKPFTTLFVDGNHENFRLPSPRATTSAPAPGTWRSSASSSSSAAQNPKRLGQGCRPGYRGRRLRPW